MRRIDVLAVARSHYPFLILAAVAAVFIFTNLGSDYLWADEGDTAVLARNIVKFGLPRAWDGKTFMDSDFGERLNSHLVMVSTPWMQYYVVAASFALVGESAFSARFPFALAGWLTIVFAYRLLWTATQDRRAALCGGILIIGSVQFLLYCRQSRYYGLAMLLTCLLIDSFLKMRSLSRTVVFGIVAVLLFHTHPIGIAPVLVLGGLTLVDSNFSSQRRWYWRALPVILALTTPWFFLARAGYVENGVMLPFSAYSFFLRLIQYLVECASITPLIGIVLLFLFVLLTQPVGQRFQQRERVLLVAIVAVVLSLLLGAVATERGAALWLGGIRYTSAIIPLLAIVAGFLISKVSRGSASILVLFLGVLTLTKFGEITPWTLWANKRPDWTDKSPDDFEDKIVAVHVPTNAIDAFLPEEDLFYVRDLFHKNVGTLGRSVEVLRQHAGPDDVVITNYESESLYFYTALPQGMKIMRQDSIYDAARRYGLPEYVFGVDHARWVVWRFHWEGYLGIPWPDVANHLVAEGGHISKVAEIKETRWENREHIHFHRFSDNVYLFSQETNFLPAKIFRVDWPAQ
jgi:hypothetical protein